MKPPYGDYERCDYCSAPAAVDLLATRVDGVIEEAALCARHYEYLRGFLGVQRYAADRQEAFDVMEVA